MKFDVRYYLVAILFILFDLEMVSLFLWAIVAEIGMFGFGAMLVFLAILVVGFIYELEKKERWNGNRRRARKGFITTSADKALNWTRTGSLWPTTFGLACCAVEMMHAAFRYYVTLTGSASCLVPVLASVRPDDRGRHRCVTRGTGSQAFTTRWPSRAALSMGSCANGGGITTIRIP